MQDHHHTHDHSSDLQKQTATQLKYVFMITMVLLLAEFLGGLISHSLALLSDAGHAFTDFFAVGMAWFAAVRAQKKSDRQNTFGYYRAGIIAAFLNAVLLILIVGWIGLEAFQRFHRPETISLPALFISASLGVALNVWNTWILHRGSHDNLNIRAAALHALGDVGASAGVLLSGFVLLFTGWQYADPIVSLVVALLIAKSAWSLLRSTIDILMEATPKDVNAQQIAGEIIGVQGVAKVHDLHIWSLDGGTRMLSAHVQIQENKQIEDCDKLINTIHTMLCNRYHITHTTIQIEKNCCEKDPQLYCDLTSHAHT